MTRKLENILKRTTLNSIINFPSTKNAYLNFEQEQIDTLTYSKLEEIVKNISVKKYIHTLVDDFKALLQCFGTTIEIFFVKSR